MSMAVIGSAAAMAGAAPFSCAASRCPPRQLQLRDSSREFLERTSMGGGSQWRSQGWGRGQPRLPSKVGQFVATRKRVVRGGSAITAAVSVGVPAVTEDESSDDSGSIPEDDVDALPAPDFKGSSSFEWKSNWYPVQVPKDMDPSRPHPVSVLGRPYVLWRSKDGEWRCFVDECPHRLVPLSEGRIDEAGRLQCSYHGWAFGASGACEAIPQAQPEGPEAKALTSPRACAVAVPTVVAQGLLFIWPDEHGWEQARATVPPVVPGLDNGEFRIRASVRDLEYGYEMLAENVMDLSHLPYAHHGVGFLKRTQGKPLPFAMADLKGAAGYTGSSPTDVFPSKSLQLEFQSPSRFTYNREAAFGGSEGRLYTNLFLTPTAPGRSRIIIQSVSNLKLPRIATLAPEYLGHLREQDILDGDSFFLHAQEKALVRRRMAPAQWAQHYFMPAAADRYVVAFRQWLVKYAGGAVQYADGVDPSLSTTWAPRERVMDRLHGHTKHCVTCSTALRNFQTAQKALAAACLLLLAAAAVNRGSPLLTAGLAIGALAAAGVAYWIQQYIQIFIYKGWDHAAR